MSYNSKQNGAANYNSWMHLNSTDVAEVTGQEGSNSQDLRDRKYAQLVYQVNASPISISGDVIVDAVELHDV